MQKKIILLDGGMGQELIKNSKVKTPSTLVNICYGRGARTRKKSTYRFYKRRC